MRLPELWGAGFAHSAGNTVSALLYRGSRLLVGGYFATINGSARKYLVSVNPSTGTDDGYVNLKISGNYVYTEDRGMQSSGNSSRVYNFDLSPDGNRLLVMGDFTSVGGQRRQQIFMLDLRTSSATLDPWYSSEFNANCATVEPFYLQAAAWSPDGTKVYVATTGYKPATGLGYRTTDPRAGLCDATAAFPSTSVSNLSRTWINYTGCDSYFSIVLPTPTMSTSVATSGGPTTRWAAMPRGRVRWTGQAWSDCRRPPGQRPHGTRREHVARAPTT